MSEHLLKTPLTEKHIALGAKMVPFAGYNMPLSYTNISDEHMAVREAAGIFDVSHMGEFIVKGPQALDLIQRITTNDASKLSPGRAQYSCMTNRSGGIVDDLIVYRLADEEGDPAFMLVVNASNIRKDWSWINAHQDFDLQLKDISADCGLIALQGPKAVEIAQTLTEVDLSLIKFYHFTKGSFAGRDDVIISATGYTGSGGFEFYASNKDTAAIWDALVKAGGPSGLKPAGLGARDTLRLEMGYCLYGNDIDDHTTPLEAGLGWITSLKKGPFVASELLARQKEEGIKRKLVGFKLEGRRVARKDYAILDENESPIGRVTSGSFSPVLQQPIGMGYVPVEKSAAGQSIFIQAGKKALPAQVVKMPAYKA